MNRLLLGVLIAAVLVVAGWFGLRHYGDARYQVGYNAAVDVGMKQRDREAAENRKIESDLRAQLAERDTEAHQKEIKYAQALADAQRRVRSGTDRLRCPAGPVQPAAAPGDRPAAAGTPADGQGPDVMPEVAADLLGIAADVAGLVRRYERAIERFDECRAVNAK